MVISKPNIALYHAADATAAIVLHGLIVVGLTACVNSEVSATPNTTLACRYIRALSKKGSQISKSSINSILVVEHLMRLLSEKPRKI